MRELPIGSLRRSRWPRYEKESQKQGKELMRSKKKRSNTNSCIVLLWTTLRSSHEFLGPRIEANLLFGLYRHGSAKSLHKLCELKRLANEAADLRRVDCARNHVPTVSAG